MCLDFDDLELSRPEKEHAANYTQAGTCLIWPFFVWVVLDLVWKYSTNYIWHVISSFFSLTVNESLFWFFKVWDQMFCYSSFTGRLSQVHIPFYFVVLKNLNLYSYNY